MDEGPDKLAARRGAISALCARAAPVPVGTRGRLRLPEGVWDPEIVPGEILLLVPDGDELALVRPARAGHPPPFPPLPERVAPLFVHARVGRDRRITIPPALGAYARTPGHLYLLSRAGRVGLWTPDALQRVMDGIDRHG